MANIELSDEEASVLADLLDAAIGDLSPEIADTDNSAYRSTLRERRQHLESVRDKLR